MERDDLAIGIDLGTTYSCVAVLQNNYVQVIPNEEGNRLTHSCVAFKGSERYVGNAARNQMISNPTNTIYAIKRLLGRRFSELSVQSDIKRWPFEVVGSSDDRPRISIDQNKCTVGQIHPEEISGMVLMKMKAIAEDFIGCRVKNAVITVPAYFNNAQRQATIAAGEIAGLNVLRIMDEPTAAAVAYGLDKVTSYSNEQNVFVFDLGGGTFDVSVLHMKHGQFEVKATSGETHLGGDDFDDRLMDFLSEQFNMKHNRDITQNARAMNMLRSHSEQAKRTLSTQGKSDIQIDCLCDGIDFCTSISRALFENLNNDLFNKCIEISNNCLIDAKMDKSHIDVVLLVGGSTRIPKVKELLQEFFNDKEPSQTINPDEAVAIGAAIMAANLSGQSNRLIQELNVTSITPLSLGVEIIGGVMSVVVPRNTQIPMKEEKKYTTVEDNQTEANIRVYQGERTLIDDNLLLGEFVLEGIPAAPRGMSTIDICFEIDDNGVLKVWAKDRTGGNKNQITITNVEGRLTRDEVEKMIEEAQKYKSQDQEYKKRYEARNSLESYAYKMSTRVLNMSSSTTKSFIREVVINAVKNAIDWVDKNKHPEASESEAKLEELMKICNLIN